MSARIEWALEMAAPAVGLWERGGTRYATREDAVAALAALRESADHQYLRDHDMRVVRIDAKERERELDGRLDAFERGE